MDPSFYVHHINPVLLHIAGPLAIRWYGLAYLAGFLGGYFLLRRLIREGWFSLPEDLLSDFIVLLAIYGILLGGRLGYVLFYGMSDFLADPTFVFRLWDGGMASHGGILGSGLFLFWYGRKHHIPFLHLSDNLCTVVPLGLFFGRMANFVNGELWGRITDVSWAVIFPMEAGIDYLSTAEPGLIHSYIQAGLLSPRHPSQLYEAAAEGLFLLVVLWWARHQNWSRRNGGLTALFAVLYSSVRFGVEFFREPDSATLFGWMTKGQSLSLILLLAGLIVWKHSNSRKPGKKDYPNP